MLRLFKKRNPNSAANMAKRIRDLRTKNKKICCKDAVTDNDMIWATIFKKNGLRPEDAMTEADINLAMEI